MPEPHRVVPHRRLKPPGTAPGTLIAPEHAAETAISVTAYNRDSVTETTVETAEDIVAFRGTGDIVWIDVAGLADTQSIARLGEMFSLHPLALEDVLNVHHRPKAEEYDDQIFVVLRMASLRDDVLDMEQIALFLGRDYVISLQERPGDCLDPVRERIRSGGKRLRFTRADYLAYALLDAVVDGYFPVLERYSERLDALEDSVVLDPDRRIMENIHAIKRDLQVLRHASWPLRDVLNRLSGDLPLIASETRPFLRDCQDHVVQIVDIEETFRERAAALTDLYLSSLSNKMNEIMKMLTLIATIFIPLSFIAGVYGMNFDPDVSPFNMPELRWSLGYPFALGVMLVIAVGLLVYFWRKGWIGSGR